MSNAKLKPCPFCGKSPYPTDPTDPEDTEFMLEHPDYCFMGQQMNPTFIQTMFPDDVRDWNRRAGRTK